MKWYGTSDGNDSNCRILVALHCHTSSVCWYVCWRVHEMRNCSLVCLYASMKDSALMCAYDVSYRCFTSLFIYKKTIRMRTFVWIKPLSKTLNTQIDSSAILILKHARASFQSHAKCCFSFFNSIETFKSLQMFNNQALRSNVSHN